MKQSLLKLGLVIFVTLIAHAAKAGEVNGTYTSKWSDWSKHYKRDSAGLITFGIDENARKSLPDGESGAVWPGKSGGNCWFTRDTGVISEITVKDNEFSLFYKSNFVKVKLIPDKDKPGEYILEETTFASGQNRFGRVRGRARNDHIYINVAEAAEGQFDSPHCRVYYNYVKKTQSASITSVPPAQQNQQTR